jgi:hypothetical protein
MSYNVRGKRVHKKPVHGYWRERNYVRPHRRTVKR